MENPLKILDLEQNTPAWLEARRSKIGASDAATILHKNPYKGIVELWEEKVYGKDEPLNYHMRVGIALEPEAREYISQKHGTKYEPLCVEDSLEPWRIASLDGWNGEIHVEIKCPTKKRILEMEDGIIPLYWEIQVQHQLLVTGTKGAFLVAYSPQKQVEIYLGRDEEMISEISEKEAHFYENYLKTRISPEIEWLTLDM